MSEVKTTYNVKISCKHCGSNDLEIPDDATDESMVTCKGCNKEVSTWGDLQKAAQDAARDQFVGEFKKQMSKIPSIKIKLF